jgi:hypothetical protein
MKTKKTKKTNKIKVPREILVQSAVDYAIATGLVVAATGTVIVSNQMEKNDNSTMALGGYLVGCGAAAAGIAMGVNATRRIIVTRRAMEEMGDFVGDLDEALQTTFGDVLDEVVQEHAEAEAANIVVLPSEEGVKVDG